MNEGKEITTSNVKTDEYSGEAGQMYKVTCPVCKQTITCADSAWWKTECECGYSWEVEVKIVATGTRH